MGVGVLGCLVLCVCWFLLLVSLFWVHTKTGIQQGSIHVRIINNEVRRSIYLTCTQDLHPAVPALEIISLIRLGQKYIYSKQV